MNRREMLLGMGKFYLQRGEPIPLDVLVEADQLGLSLADFGEPTHLNAKSHEGDIHNGTEQQEDDFPNH